MTGCPRTTAIGRIYVNTVGTSSVAHFGDNGTTKLSSRALAVQRAVPEYAHDETKFAAYRIFTRPLLELNTGVSVDFSKEDRESEIRIGCLRAVALSASSLLRAGVTGPFVARTRIKHIRNFNFRDRR